MPQKQQPGGAVLVRGRESYVIDPSPVRQILDFRGLGLDAVLLLGRYRYSKAGHGLATHSHGEMIEISYLESGQQTYVLNGRDYPMAGGDIFVALPGEQHGTGTHPETRGVMYWFLISVIKARQSFLNIPQNEGRELLQRLLQIQQHCFHGSNTLQPTLHSIFKEYANIQNPLRVTNLRNLLLRFLLDVVASAYKTQPITQSTHIRSIIAYVEANLEQPLSLAELAQHAGLSLPRLKSKFKQEMGVTPGDYIARRRVQRAAQLLYETDDSVTDIAMRLGFSSSQYFATVFKRYTLHSPQSARVTQMNL
jgi:AraC-like DNA-binding protein